MDNNWINLIAAILVGGGTLFLGIMAWRTIHQTRSIQKAEKRERLLNEIIEWAIDMLKGGDSEASIKLASENIRDEVRQTLLKMSSVNIFEGFKARSPYILLVSRTFGDKLGNAVEKAIQELNKTTELLYKLFGSDTFEGIEELGKQRYELLNPAINAVIEEATKIKTKDIGKKEENMSKEGEATGTNEPTLKDIDDHLNQQDKQIKKGNYLTGSVFGAAIALVGISFMAQMSFQLSPYVYVWFFIIAGLGFMFWCKWKQSKIK